jgi:hypothetical protein
LEIPEIPKLLKQAAQQIGHLGRKAIKKPKLAPATAPAADRRGFFVDAPVGWRTISE